MIGVVVLGLIFILGFFLLLSMMVYVFIVFILRMVDVGIVMFLVLSTVKSRCPVCGGKLVLVSDIWNFRRYHQCVLCGSRFKEDMSDFDE